MTQEAASYAIWQPEHDGHAPPYWREGMKWTRPTMPADFDGSGHPEWLGGWEYHVEPEALTAPNDDVGGDVDAWRRNDAPIDKRKALRGFIQIIKDYPPEMLAEEGITLAPEKDWATELWADLMDAWAYPLWAGEIRERIVLADDDRAAIALIRERVVLKERV